MIGALPPTTPIQYSLPRMPKPTADVLPVYMALKRATVTRCVEAGWLSIGARVLPIVQDMRIDDVLYFGGVWRVERLLLNKGYPHFRLIWMHKRHYVFGVADVRSDSQLWRVQCYLAAYLAVFGATPENTKLVRGVAWTPLNADTSRQYRLFRVKGDSHD